MGDAFVVQNITIFVTQKNLSSVKKSFRKCDWTNRMRETRVFQFKGIPGRLALSYNVMIVSKEVAIMNSVASKRTESV